MSAQAPTAGAEGRVELVIRPRSGWVPIDWSELYQYRELLWFLTWRDVKARYKQAVLGMAWAVIQPLISLVLLTTIGSLSGIKDRVHSDAPYALYVYSGLLPWLFCAVAITKGGNSLVGQQALLTKIYLPRVFVPAASVGAALVDMLISLAIFFALMAWYEYVPSWRIVFLPLLLLATWVIAMGIALTLSAMNVLYRDMRIVLPFLVQIGMWCSAVFYPPDLLGRHDWLIALNPIAGIIACYRWAFFGVPIGTLNMVLSTTLGAAIFLFGLFYFRRCERRFADLA